jgi:hypothetical protein
MRRITNFQIQKELLEDAFRAGRFNPSLEITFRDRTGIHTHKIGAGYSDELDVYREAGVTYVLARNNALPYVGLEAFEGDEKVGDLFLQEGQVIEVLGRSDLAPVTMIKRLQPYLIS